MLCRLCGGRIVERPKSWSCENSKCGFVIWKEIGQHRITKDVVEELLRNGRTKVLDGFRSKKGKLFSAALVIKDGRVEYEFPKVKGARGAKEDEVDNTVHIQVEAGSSGRCYLSISGTVNKQAEINFGLVPATEAECLALITAAKYINHVGKASGRIKISLNNLNLSRYILKERVPRDREMKKLVELARKTLDRTGRWEVEYKPERRPKLKGGPLADTFPYGIFPWIDVKMQKEDGRLVITLPDDPAVRAQFKASMYRSTINGDGHFILPATAEKAVHAWINRVRGI